MIAGFTDKRGNRFTLDEVKAIVQEEGWFDSVPYPIVMGIIRLQERIRHPGIHASEIPKCPRNSYYNRSHETWPTLERLYWMFRGTLAHAVLEGIPEPGSLVEHTLTREINGVTVVGTPDKIIPKRSEINDWKTTKRIIPDNLPYGDHEMQVNIYRWLAAPQWDIENLKITYMDMNQNLTVTVPPRGFGELDEYIEPRAIYLQKCLDDNALPKATRTIQGKTNWLCRYCDFKEKCDHEESRNQAAAAVHPGSDG